MGTCFQPLQALPVGDPAAYRGTRLNRNRKPAYGRAKRSF